MGKYNKEENCKKEIRIKLGLPPNNPTDSSKNKDNNYIPPERFYTEKEEVTLRFYQTLKSLFENPEYLGFSLGSKYEIIAGERRFRATGQAGLKEIPAIIKDVSNGEDARIISLIENIQREDLNDIDHASALRELKVNLGSTWEVIAKKLGLTKRRVLDLVGLLDLPDEIKEDIKQKKLTERHGRALRQLLDKAEVLRDVFSFIKDKKLIGEQTQEPVQAVKSEPQYTIEDCFNNLSQRAQTGQKPRLAASPLALFETESKHLSKILDKVLISELSQPERNILKEGLREIQKKINELLDKIKI